MFTIRSNSALENISCGGNRHTFVDHYCVAREGRVGVTPAGSLVGDTGGDSPTARRHQRHLLPLTGRGDLISYLI